MTSSPEDRSLSSCFQNSGIFSEKFGRKIEMPVRCVAFGCSKSHKDNVTLFMFPKQQEIYRKWEKQVQRTRAKWIAKPTSELCSDHFEKECFDLKPILMREMGLSPKCPLRLNKGAIPSIFPRPVSVTLKSTTATPSTITATPTAASTPATGSDDITPKPAKRRRIAFEKRERARVSLLTICK